MVEFGKKLKERQIKEWQGYYINYKLMKKKVKQYANQIQARALDHRHVLKDFSRMLDTQIEKIVLFMLEQQGLLASRISQLNEQQESLQEQPDISKICDLREAYRAVGRDLLELLFFVEMNAMGLRMILKNFDKRLGYKFTDYYVKTILIHNFSKFSSMWDLELSLELFLEILEIFRTAKEATYLYMTNPLFHSRILLLMP